MKPTELELHYFHPSIVEGGEWWTLFKETMESVGMLDIELSGGDSSPDAILPWHPIVKLTWLGDTVQLQTLLAPLLSYMMLTATTPKGIELSISEPFVDKVEVIVTLTYHVGPEWKRWHPDAHQPV